MSCRRTPDDHAFVAVADQHTTICDGATPAGANYRWWPRRSCRGCHPCDRRHCTSCTIHLEPGQLQTCDDCRGQARRDLAAIVDLAALLPDHALNAGHDGNLEAAAPIPGGDALVMLSRGSEGLLDDNTTTRPDEPHTPSFMFAWWSEQWRDQLNLESLPTPWRRRPARVLTQAHAFLDQHLGWAASNHRGFHVFTHDLARLRRHLEELLCAGEHPTEGVGCFHCGHTLVRDYRPPSRCDCGPPPILRHDQHAPCGCDQPADHDFHPRTDRSCLACHAEAKHAAAHATHDQGGLDLTHSSSGWYCPGCDHTYTVGEYDLALRTDYGDVAEYLPLADCIEATGAKRGSIQGWATRGHVRKRRDASGRVTYRVADVLSRHADRPNATG